MGYAEARGDKCALSPLARAWRSDHQYSHVVSAQPPRSPVMRARSLHASISR
jgi:hypothetical protein